MKLKRVPASVSYESLRAKHRPRPPVETPEVREAADGMQVGNAPTPSAQERNETMLSPVSPDQEPTPTSAEPRIEPAAETSGQSDEIHETDGDAENSAAPKLSREEGPASGSARKAKGNPRKAPAPRKRHSPTRAVDLKARIRIPEAGVSGELDQLRTAYGDKRALGFVLDRALADVLDLVKEGEDLPKRHLVWSGRSFANVSRRIDAETFELIKRQLDPMDLLGPISLTKQILDLALSMYLSKEHR